MSYYNLLESRIARLESLVYNEANKSISDTIENARQAASFLKSLGFIKGKRFSGTKSSYYYIGNDCGIILSSSALFFPKKYNVTKDILDTDYTLINTLPTLGFALQKKGLQPSKTTIDETIAYTLLNNGRDEIIGFPASKDEIEKNISNAQKDGKKIRELINSYFDKVSNKKESLIRNEAKENTDVIVKVGNKWRVKGRKVKYWNAEYDTKADAEDALKAYWANKHECLKHRHRRLKLEGFSNDEGKELLRNVQHFLIKIFGHTLYFDHYTDKAVDLYYRGDLVAELFFKEATKDQNEEIVIMPANPDFAPVSKEVSEYELQDYLSGLILGDV